MVTTALLVGTLCTGTGADRGNNMNHASLGLAILRGRAMAYECVGITVVALVATASSLLHNAVTVLSCVKKFNPALP